MGTFNRSVWQALYYVYVHHPPQVGTLSAQPCVAPARGFMSLPLEIVLLIAEDLSEMGRTSDLAAFARLLPHNSQYTRVVQQVLFGCVNIESYDRYANLTRTLQNGGTLGRCQELASMVHSISAVLNTQPAQGEQRFLARHILNLYEQCPDLKHITILGGHDGRLPEHLTPNVEDLDHIVTLEAIESLNLNCPLGLLGPSLLTHLPCLKELHIAGGPATLRLADPPRSGPRLRRVTWGSETPPTLRLIKWLFAYSTEETEGAITLLTPPTSEFEFEGIREYTLRRRMDFRSPPVPCLTKGET